MKTIDTTNASVLQNLYEDDPDTYEQFMLAALYKNKEFLGQALPCITLKNEYGKELSLFSIPENQAMFRVIKSWREKNADAEMSPSILHTFLTIMAKQTNPLVYEHQVMDVVEKFQSIMDSVDAANATYVVESTWREWSLQRSFDLANREHDRTGREDMAAHIEKLMSIRNAILSSGGDKTTRVSVMQAFTQAAEPVEFMQLGADLQAINICLGGGLGRKEHVLFVAPSGGGKTVMACQIAAYLASLGKHVLYFTTEQPPSALIPRMVSCLSCGTANPILVSTMKAGIDKRQMTETQWGFVTNVMKAIDQTLLFEDWTTTKKAVASDLRGTVESWIDDLAAKGAKPDCVILDWIGGKLGADAANPDKRRIVFEQAAISMKDIAIDFDVSAISFAQATPTSGRKLYISQDDIAESKAMWNMAHACFGMSAKRISEGTGGNAVYSDHQKLCCFKSRTGITAIANLDRDFKHQRFICKSLSSK